MSVAVKSEVCFNDSGHDASRMLGAGTFTGLDTADRRALSDWLDGADRIDTVIDLAVRSWNIDGVTGIIGVFEIDRAQASWLIVRSGSGWTLARCSDSSISEELESLPDVLGLIDEQFRN